ncbi:MAG: hypothetical protein EXR79_17125 [Myxococcales bacterium]|nr:hypothetical protein [Myxococcales bacterium]
MISSFRHSRNALSVAIFVGAVIAGAGLRAGATPPCRLVQALVFQVTSATIGASAHKVPSFAEGSFFFDATNNDPDLGTFNATVYDPDTDTNRTLTLKRKP